MNLRGRTKNGREAILHTRAAPDDRITQSRISLVQPLSQTDPPGHRIQLGDDEPLLGEQQVRANHPRQLIAQRGRPLDRYQFRRLSLIQNLGHPSRRTPLEAPPVQLVHRLVELMENTPQRLDLRGQRFAQGQRPCRRFPAHPPKEPSLRHGLAQRLSPINSDHVPSPYEATPSPSTSSAPRMVA